MIFCGDIAIPDVSIGIDIPIELRQKNWFVNLEGSLIDSSKVDNMRVQYNVFNNNDAVKQLSELLNIRVCSLANNHIEDCNTVDNTVKYLESIGLGYVGGGVNLEEAEKPIVIPDENMTVLSFGWDVIKCPLADTNRSGVNPYKIEHVVTTVKKNLHQAENLICFFHWGYELEAYPLPYDRELAHMLIDMGVKAVIGCHAHRVQQIEFYNGHPIVYGLGNFLFPHSYFWDGRLKFPEFTKKELAFEITHDGRFVSHWFEYDIMGKRLQYMKSEKVGAGMNFFEGCAEYENLSYKEYNRFFKVNRYHKKLIPIFMSKENRLLYAAKSRFVKYRGLLIDLLVKLNVKVKK